MLTEDLIRAIQANASPQKRFDGRGLYRLLTPGGGRLWRFKYRFPPRSTGNKEKLISFGRYPEVSLEQARERRDAARRDIANGIDPSRIETQLSHADRNKVRASYNHAKYLPQRRTMMQSWAGHLDSLRGRGSLDVSLGPGQPVAMCAMDAFRHVESERALSFQAQAMEALRAIIKLCPKPSGSDASLSSRRQGLCSAL